MFLASRRVPCLKRSLHDESDGFKSRLELFRISTRFEVIPVISNGTDIHAETSDGFKISRLSNMIQNNSDTKFGNKVHDSK